MTPLLLSASIILKAFQALQSHSAPSSSKVSKVDSEKAIQSPVLAVSLFRSLVLRLNDPDLWFPTVHQAVLLQALLSQLHHDLRAGARSRLSSEVLALLGTMARTEVGARALLASDLDQMLWLPLSEVKQVSQKVFCFARSLSWI